jgi:hypothetical protein
MFEDNVNQDRIKVTYEWNGAAASLPAGGSTNPRELGDINSDTGGYK